METKRTWTTSKAIKDEHQKLDIRQIYLWFITADKMMPVVSGKSGNFQLPGGKPEINETQVQTIKREMFEETGIKLDLTKYTPELFGYYIIENDPNWNLQPYLQIRYILKVNESSKDLNLSINERADDKDVMTRVKFILVDEIPKYLPYLNDREEYITIKTLLN